jgi:type IV secretory pathway TrbD component
MIEHRFHKSSFRPALVMGAERKPMLFLVVVCVSLAFTSVNLVALAIAAFLWITVHPLLVWMGTIDPYMVGVYLRSQKYPGYIRPFTTAFRKHVGYRIPPENKSWKFWNR